MTRVGKFAYLFVLLVLLVPLFWLSAPESTSAASNGFINGGFETGNFSGWNVSIAPGGNAQVVSIFNYTVPAPGNYTPKEGSYFALLTNGQQDVFTVVSQLFYGGTGSVISGWSFFKTTDLQPWNDEGMAEITLNKGGLVVANLFHASVPSVGDFGGTPWTYWSYALTMDAEYTIQAKVTNRRDSAIPSYLGLDGVSLHFGSPPKPDSSPAMPASNAIAIIVVKNVAVNPQQAYTGQPITISANVANDGDAVGSFSAYLRINGKVEQTKTGAVDGHSAIPVNFTVSKSEPGAYTVDIGGQKGTFTVMADKTTSASPVSSSAIVIAIMFVLILGTVVVLMLTFRRSS